MFRRRHAQRQIGFSDGRKSPVPPAGTLSLKRSGRKMRTVRCGSGRSLPGFWRQLQRRCRRRCWAPATTVAPRRHCWQLTWHSHRPRWPLRHPHRSGPRRQCPPLIQFGRPCGQPRDSTTDGSYSPGSLTHGEVHAGAPTYRVAPTEPGVPEGRWKGTITLPGGGDLAFSVLISLDDSVLQTKMDTPAQCAYELELTEAGYESEHLPFELESPVGLVVWEGRVNWEVIEGHFSQPGLP